MATPSSRTPIRIARGTYANLNASIADIQEGEICYATDQDKLYVKESGSLVSTQAVIDPDTAKTDVVQTFSAAQRGQIQGLAIPVGGNLISDFNVSNNYSVNLDQNITFANPSNLTQGQSGSIFFVQDATGSRTVAWGSYWDFAGGTAPTLSTAANAVDRVDYVVRSSTSIHAVATLNYS